MDRKNLNDAFDSLEPSPVVKQRVMGEVNAIDDKKKAPRKSSFTVRLVAVLSAVILIIGIGIPLGLGLFDNTKDLNAMSTFSSYAQLKRFIRKSNGSKSGGWWGGIGTADLAAPESSAGADRDTSDSSSHSETNTHVAGVDEGDIVKTDGAYIYTVNSASLTIIDADTLTVEVKLTFGSFSPSELYLPKEGDAYSDYVVLTGSFYNEKLYKKLNGNRTTAQIDVFDCCFYPYYSHNSTMVKIYSLEALINAGNDKTESQYNSAALINSYEFEYTYLTGTRMIDGVLYLIMNYYNLSYSNFITPAYSQNGRRKTMPASKITLINRNDSYYSMLMIGTVDVTNGGSNMSGYLGNGYTVYCSKENLYISASDYVYDQNYHTYYTRSYSVTNIYKFALDKTSVAYDGKFTADGYIKDQFSIDEYDGHLRVATTVWQNVSRNYNLPDGTSMPEVPGITTGNIRDNIVTVFDLDTAEETGRLTGLGKLNETIYSVRFNGGTAVLVTYLQTDPFYVIDLSDPANPEKIGELSIPGVSDYMQFYRPAGTDDESLVFTIGRAEAGAGVLSGIKAELYDISDPSNPIAVSTYTVNSDGYSYSEASYNYKAITAFENIFAFPVTEYSYEYTNGYYKDTSKNRLNLYLIDDNARTMSELKIPFHSKALTTPDYNTYSYYSDTLRRSVIIKDSLYLIGTYTLQRHSLTDLKNQITNEYDLVEF